MDKGVLIVSAALIRNIRQYTNKKIVDILFVPNIVENYY